MAAEAVVGGRPPKRPFTPPPPKREPTGSAPSPPRPPPPGPPPPRRTPREEEEDVRLRQEQKARALFLRFGHASWRMNDMEQEMADILRQVFAEVARGNLCSHVLCLMQLTANGNH